MSQHYLIDTTSRRFLKEQLRLFAFDSSPSRAIDVAEPYHELSTRERLAALLEGELNFHGENSGYASHDLHSFAAKFPPQLPRAFIRGLTKPGDTVLDPMMGSGTAVVEALLEGRHGIGLDIDPLAIRLGRVKTRRVEVARLSQIGDSVLTRAKSLVQDAQKVEAEINSRFDEPTRAFIDYWFLRDTQSQLMALVMAIEDESDPLTRDFLELTFSSTIVTKSGGVSRARDLAHSRPHLVKTKKPQDALELFAARLRRNIISINRLVLNGTSSSIVEGDARILPLQDASVDLIVTSPPYANAIDYMRAHKFSLVWLGKPVNKLTRLRAKYIGSEGLKDAPDALLPVKTHDVIQDLAALDVKKAGVLRKYLVEMKSVIREMHRVLRRDAAAVIVVGTSNMRGIDVQTHQCLADIASDEGFEVVGIAERILDRNKRMMPARFGKKTDSMIEQRMHEEYVIGLLKP